MSDATENELTNFLIGDSPAMHRVRVLIRKFAPSSVPVLIQGPTGSGKELVAQALHTLSGRSGSFVAFNVCAIADGMFEDQLFGHRRGAFTGASTETAGYLLEAHRGTLFLDEISSLPLATQPKLLRAIDSKQFRQHGSRADRRSDFRVISATNENLRDLVASGRFREDLYFRLRSGVIELPSLDDRRGDVPLLARHFAAFATRPTGGRPPLADDAVALLLDYHWPGNVRELKQLIECAAALADGHSISGADLARAMILADVPLRPNKRLDTEARRLIEVMDHTGWKVKPAAQILGIDKTTVYRQLERLGVSLRRAHDAADGRNGQGSRRLSEVAQGDR